MPQISQFIQHIHLFPHTYRIEHETTTWVLRCDPETSIILDCRFHCSDPHSIDTYNAFSNWLIGQAPHQLTDLTPPAELTKPIAKILIQKIQDEAKKEYIC